MYANHQLSLRLLVFSSAGGNEKFMLEYDLFTATTMYDQQQKQEQNKPKLFCIQIKHTTFFFFFFFSLFVSTFGSFASFQFLNKGIQLQTPKKRNRLPSGLCLFLYAKQSMEKSIHIHAPLATNIKYKYIKILK